MISLWYVNQEYVTWWQMHYHECQTSQNKKEYQIKQRTLLFFTTGMAIEYFRMFVY